MDSTNILNAAWPFLIMAFLFYFMMYRPQKKQQNERATLLNGLKVGAKIVTIGGIFGEITKIHDDKITLKIADNLEIKILRSAVGNLQKSSALEAAKKEKDAKTEEAKEAKDAKDAKDTKDAKDAKDAKVEEKPAEAPATTDTTEQKNG